MAASACYFQRALGGVLAAYVLEVHVELLGFAEQALAVHFQRHDAVAGVHEADHVQQRFDRIDFYSADHCRFLGIELGHDQPRNLSAACLNGDGQRSTNSPNSAIEGQFADEKAIWHLLLINDAISPENSQ